MKTTWYYDNDVRIRRPYLRDEWCERVLADPIKVERERNGRIRHWGIIEEAGHRVLRVVTLPDGETVHNAFFDRGFSF
ncbi:MAG TPA: hypothetical protein VFE42_13605 [Chloroflexota bacterium]|nr:hypothetical protein [Chloroflexota bacterium]